LMVDKLPSEVVLTSPPPEMTMKSPAAKRGGSLPPTGASSAGVALFAGPNQDIAPTATPRNCLAQSSSIAANAVLSSTALVIARRKIGACIKLNAENKSKRKCLEHKYTMFGK